MTYIKMMFWDFDNTLAIWHHPSDISLRRKYRELITQKTEYYDDHCSACEELRLYILTALRNGIPQYLLSKVDFGIESALQTKWVQEHYSPDIMPQSISSDKGKIVIMEEMARSASVDRNHVMFISTNQKSLNKAFSAGFTCQQPMEILQHMFGKENTNNGE